jgi:hypothetical protein
VIVVVAWLACTFGSAVAVLWYVHCGLMAHQLSRGSAAAAADGDATTVIMVVIWLT